jgi:KDO2-lipid IV(A) lauroyltransferase
MIVYQIAIAFGRIVSLLPFRLIYGLSNFIAWILGTVLNYRSEVIAKNLKASFPEMTEKLLKETQKGFYRNFADIIVESFKSLSISEKSMRSFSKTLR